MALVAAANGSATLHRRWPASDAELKRLEAKLGYTFRGEEAGAGLPCGSKSSRPAAAAACLPPRPTRGLQI